MRSRLLLGACALTLAVAACGDSGGSSASSSSSAAATVCKSKQQIQSALNDIRSVTPQTVTTGQLRTDVQTIENALSDAASARGVISESRVNDVRSAVESLKNTLQTSLPTGTSLSQVQAVVTAQVAAVGAAVSALFESVPC